MIYHSHAEDWGWYTPSHHRCLEEISTGAAQCDVPNGADIHASISRIRERRKICTSTRTSTKQASTFHSQIEYPVPSVWLTTVCSGMQEGGQQCRCAITRCSEHWSVQSGSSVAFAQLLFSYKIISHDDVRGMRTI